VANILFIINKKFGFVTPIILKIAMKKLIINMDIKNRFPVSTVSNMPIVFAPRMTFRCQRYKKHVKN